jgi:hypothetical protein
MLALKSSSSTRMVNVDKKPMYLFNNNNYFRFNEPFVEKALVLNRKEQILLSCFS